MVSKPNLGMAHLIGQTDKRQEPQPEPDGWTPLPDNQCTLLRLLLSGKEYFIPGDVHFSVQFIPPFPFLIPTAYSELRKDDKFLGAARHDDLKIYGTGFTLERVMTPSWWKTK